MFVIKLIEFYKIDYNKIIKVYEQKKVFIRYMYFFMKFNLYCGCNMVFRD